MALMQQATQNTAQDATKRLVAAGLHGQSMSAVVATSTQVWPAIDMPEVEWTPAVERETAPIYERLKTIIPSIEWPFHAPYIHRSTGSRSNAMR